MRRVSLRVVVRVVRTVPPCFVRIALLRSRRWRWPIPLRAPPLAPRAALPADRPVHCRDHDPTLAHTPTSCRLLQQTLMMPNQALATGSTRVARRDSAWVARWANCRSCKGEAATPFRRRLRLVGVSLRRRTSRWPPFSCRAVHHRCRRRRSCRPTVRVGPHSRAVGDAASDLRDSTLRLRLRAWI